MSFFLLLNTKEDILKNMGNQQLLDPIDFLSIFLSSYYGSQWGPNLTIKLTIQ